MIGRTDLKTQAESARSAARNRYYETPMKPGVESEIGDMLDRVGAASRAGNYAGVIRACVLIQSAIDRVAKARKAVIAPELIDEVRRLTAVGEDHWPWVEDVGEMVTRMRSLAACVAERTSKPVEFVSLEAGGATFQISEYRTTQVEDVNGAITPSETFNHRSDAGARSGTLWFFEINAKPVDLKDGGVGLEYFVRRKVSRSSSDIGYGGCGL